MPRSVLGELYDKCVFSLVRNCQLFSGIAVSFYSHMTIYLSRDLYGLYVYMCSDSEDSCSFINSENF